MCHNSFGHLFRVTTWGESHGPAIGCVVDGCPPRLALSEADIQPWLDRRRPGQSRFTTPAAGTGPGAYPVRRVRGPDHRHADRVADRERGPALARLLRDRSEIPPRPCRPHLRAEIRHPRLSRRRAVVGARDRDAGRRRRRWRARCWGGACGSAARWCRSDRTASTARAGTGTQVDANPFFCPDPVAATEWEDYPARGAQGRLFARRGDRGRGRRRAPRPRRADLRQAGCGSGGGADVDQRGEGRGDRRRVSPPRRCAGRTNADEMRMRGRRRWRSWPTTPAASWAASRPGQPVVARFAVKPTSSILTPRADGGSRRGRRRRSATKGRHDPCVGIRAVPVGEAMMACVLADHLLRHRAQNPDAPEVARLPRN